MIPRYTRPAMGRIWSDENKYRAWLEVETVASEILAEDGIVPVEAAKAIRERGGFDIERIQQIEAEVPAYADIHLILDNYATHKHPKVKAWLAKHPRFHLHFTPTSASWMNLVERFFRDLSQDVILPGSFQSVDQLVAEIWAYLAERNLSPTRYVWRAQGQQILQKIQRAEAALARASEVAVDTSGTAH